MPEGKPLAFASACKRFFGFQQNQSLAEFVQELRRLSQKDVSELAFLLSKELGEPVSSTISWSK